MQAVILAAGKSTRTYPLTLTKPKPLLKVAGKTILEHNLIQLEGLVDEVIFVVGYKSKMIEDFLKNKFGKIIIKYVQQNEALGNADALKQVENLIKGKFILMFGDDLYSKKDIKNLLKHKNAMLAQKVKNPENFGVLKINKDIFYGVVEKPKEFISDLANIGCFVFSKEIFGVLDKINLSKRNEYELTDAYNLLAKKEKIKVIQVKDYWLPLTYPWSLLEANECLAGKIKGKISKNATVEKGAMLKGKVFVGADTIIKSGSYIEGPVMIGKNCVIGPNCYLRAFTVIGDNSHIGNAVEIKNSIIGDNTNVAHLSYVGDSIIGDNCNLAGGTIMANLRHDGKSVRCMIKGELKDTGRLKLGVIMGDNCKTGIHTSIYPGVKINPGYKTLPGDVVKRDLI
jgi:UDP-N-acetylglucosamine diphosphorylase / glucose-1-phosphate thymidylyltransferase / UDP-N-acetylgalactosamine diphosphorylase / glucosamine-1-phosphate N-acetyltransferase / galactosamine-1-phosphate N-acetyltransferase